MKRIHYAWVIAAVTFIALMGAAGFRSTPGVLIVPLEHEFGWNRAVISVAVSINLILFGLTGPFAAALMDRFGLRAVTVGALITVASGALLTTLMTSPWELYLLWGVVVGLGTGCMASVLAATVAGRWFVHRRGLVLGAPARSDRCVRRRRHARIRLPHGSVRQPPPSVHLLRTPRRFASSVALCVRQPAVRADPLHRLLRPGLGRDGAADRPAGAQSFPATELRHCLRVDLRGAPARRGHDRICRGRREDLLRRLPDRLHELRIAVPRRGGARLADQPPAPGSGRGNGRRSRGTGLLLSPARLSLAGLAFAAALLPQAALAHAQLVQSDPAPRATLQSVPAAITLLFTETVTPAGPGIRVFSPSGRQVARSTVMRGAVLTASIDSAETGTFVVTWQVFAADTHPSRGSFSFDGGKPSSNPYSALIDASQIGTSTPLGLAMQTLARWVHFAGFALVFGVVAYRVLIRRDESFKRLVWVGIVLLIVAEPLTLIAQLASLSFDGDTAVAVLGSNFGRLLALRLGAALLLWTLIATRRSWPLLVVGSVVALLVGP